MGLTTVLFGGLLAWEMEERSEEIGRMTPQTGAGTCVPLPPSDK